MLGAVPQGKKIKSHREAGRLRVVRLKGPNPIKRLRRCPRLY
jgi:hypothetical protein